MRALCTTPCSCLRCSSLPIIYSSIYTNSASKPTMCQYTTTDTDNPTGTCDVTNVNEPKRHVTQHMGKDQHTIVVYDTQRPNGLPLLSSAKVADRDLLVQFEEPSVCVTGAQRWVAHRVHFRG